MVRAGAQYTIATNAIGNTVNDKRGTDRKNIDKMMYWDYLFRGNDTLHYYRCNGDNLISHLTNGIAIDSREVFNQPRANMDPGYPSTIVLSFDVQI